MGYSRRVVELWVAGIQELQSGKSSYLGAGEGFVESARKQTRGKDACIGMTVGGYLLVLRLVNLAGHSWLSGCTQGPATTRMYLTQLAHRTVL